MRPDALSLTLTHSLTHSLTLTHSLSLTLTRSPQEAVDFVRKRIKAGQCLQSICEEMCDYCLAPDLQGLCRGADNMSVIILMFKGTSDLGRPLLVRVQRSFSCCV